MKDQVLLVKIYRYPSLLRYQILIAYTYTLNIRYYYPELNENIKMKKIIFVTLILSLSGCFELVKPAILDPSSAEAIEDSAQKIINGLTEEEEKEFNKALQYYSFQAYKIVMNNAFTTSGMKPHDEIMRESYSSIAGLTGKQIIEKYHLVLEKKRIKTENKNIKI